MSKPKLAIALAVIAIAVGPATSALAVTNPASNPAPITVTGDDGNTYNDGADTLPGFDDEECTYIPGTYFDFANNKVHYADGQSIHWTEWDRATGYQDWQVKQSQVSTPVKTATPSSSASPSTASTKNTKSSATATKQDASNPAATASPAATAAGDINAQTTDQELANFTYPLNSNDSNPGRAAGLVILASLFATGLLLTAGNGIRQRLIKRGNNQ
ncbi:MAG: hypothetical protein ACKOWE_05975 [Micrococcales bacterium]